jgi:hypothetical protein
MGFLKDFLIEVESYDPYDDDNPASKELIERYKPRLKKLGIKRIQVTNGGKSKDIDLN